MKTKGGDKVSDILPFVKSRSRKKRCSSFTGINIKLREKNLFSKTWELKYHVGNCNINKVKTFFITLMIRNHSSQRPP